MTPNGHFWNIMGRKENTSILENGMLIGVGILFFKMPCKLLVFTLCKQLSKQNMKLAEGFYLLYL
jgi:hypothetical protein